MSKGDSVEYHQDSVKLGGDLAELIERLERAVMNLDGMAASGAMRERDERLRLTAKRDGVALALSYAKEMNQ